MGILFSNPINEYQLNEGLCKACREGSIELANHYISKGANDVNRAFYNACKGGHINLVKLMIVNGADDFDVGCECALDDIQQFHVVDYLVANYKCPSWYYTLNCKYNINHRYIWITGYKYNQLLKYTKLNENLINMTINTTKYF